MTALDFNRPYRTLFVGILVQDSSLSVGGNQGDGESDVDSPLSLDGEGRPTIRGTTLAGALVDTARKLFGDIPAFISSSPTLERGAEYPPESLWRLFNTHPEPESTRPEAPEPRSGVGISQDTGAAAHQVLFDLETLPVKTAWWFLLEVDTSRDGGLEAEWIAAAALREWERGRCWVGRNVARGLGWMTLTDLKAYRLPVGLAESWPNSFLTPQKAIEALEVAAVISTDFNRIFSLQEKLDAQSGRWVYVELEGALQAAPHVFEDRQYGIDALAVRGHANGPSGTDWFSHLLLPEHWQPEAVQREFNPDLGLAMTRLPDGRTVPFIPGSSLRGPLRHALSRLLRSRDLPVWDPNSSPTPDSETVDCVEELFGSTRTGAALLIRDAYLDDPDQWRGAWLQQHAGDEFTAGVYGTDKFDTLALLQARFHWKMVIEAPDGETARRLYSQLEEVLGLATEGQLAVGSQQWRGLGWARWTMESTRNITAGEDK